MTQAPTAAEIAGKLTKAQRDWLRNHKVSEKWLTAHGLENTSLMEATGTTSRWGGEVNKHYRLSSLGLAVRAILMEQDR